ncbi:hypothetical protein [Burkholderia cepacia]|uniref:hypothetical protein n=1 Tax=Burkholderia cepacia TaxID=292 RepID=UPI000F5A186B|nr:hypothetical protein [Burkholderia cepacia]
MSEVHECLPAAAGFDFGDRFDWQLALGEIDTPDVEDGASRRGCRHVGRSYVMPDDGLAHDARQASMEFVCDERIEELPGFGDESKAMLVRMPVPLCYGARDPESGNGRVLCVHS